MALTAFNKVSLSGINCWRKSHNLPALLNVMSNLPWLSSEMFSASDIKRKTSGSTLTARFPAFLLISEMLLVASHSENTAVMRSISSMALLMAWCAKALGSDIGRRILNSTVVDIKLTDREALACAGSLACMRSLATTVSLIMIRAIN